MYIICASDVRGCTAPNPTPREETMTALSRRTLLATGSALAATAALPAIAQQKPNIRFAAVFT